MTDNYPHAPIGGAKPGFKCLITGRAFYADGNSREARAAAYRDQQNFSREVVRSLQAQRRQRLSLPELQRLYRASKEESNNG